MRRDERRGLLRVLDRRMARLSDELGLDGCEDGYRLLRGLCRVMGSPGVLGTAGALTRGDFQDAAVRMAGHGRTMKAGAEAGVR